MLLRFPLTVCVCVLFGYTAATLVSLVPKASSKAQHSTEALAPRGSTNRNSEGSKQWGGSSLSHNRRSNGNAADAKFSVGGSNRGRLTVGGGGGSGATFTRPGFEPPTKKTPVR